MPIFGWAAALCHQRWESEERLKEMLSNSESMPKLLILSGLRDELVPPKHSEELYQLVKGHKLHSNRVTMKTFEKGTHNDTFLQPGYFEAIAAFIKSL
jgi:fermentation-respiration switch protein FrsA (DUF1100 family)